jgi:pyruvate/2-oxoglutarate dehydrogenase complex dihydrolipoamide dehydrogenase (E3) component
VSVVFSDPQIAMVGSTFRELSEKFSACGCFEVGEVSFENQAHSRVMLRNKGILHGAYRDWIKKCQSGLTDRHYAFCCP